MGFALALYAAFVAALTVAEYRGDKRAQYLLKPACALGFILIALMSGALESLYGQIILAGLCFCAAGDVALLSRTSMKLFLSGMIAFALGHIFFALGFIEWGWAATVKNGFEFKIIMPICAGIALYFFGTHSLLEEAPLNMVWPIRLYAVIIITMCGLSLLTRNASVITAAFMFGLSDIVVGRDRFLGHKPHHALAITPLYFGAQALFALSVAQVL